MDVWGVALFGLPERSATKQNNRSEDWLHPDADRGAKRTQLEQHRAATHVGKAHLPTLGYNRHRCTPMFAVQAPNGFFVPYHAKVS